MRRITRARAAITAAAVATLALAGTAGASLGQLPPGAQVNDDPAVGIDPARDAGASDVVGGSLAAGGVRVPWAAFEQKTPGQQQIFVRAFKGGAWKTQGRSLNIDPAQEAEAPSIDFAGAGRTVPWTAWYEPNVHLGDGHATNIFASRFAAAQNTWMAEGQDRAPAFKVPSLNIHTDREAENPALAGGAAVAGNDPVPWVAWQEQDGGTTTGTTTNQIFVSRAIKQTDCSANQPGGGTSVGAFCWQQTGLGRLAADRHARGLDPTLNVDPTRNGVEPDIAFTGPGDTVPWVVWYETDKSAIGLHDNEMVFAAKAVNDGNGQFHWVIVGNRASATLDNTGGNAFGGCSASQQAEGDCSLNADPARDAEDPRVAAGTLTPGTPTVPWVAWAETTATGNHAVFVSRLVGGTHFELANGGQPISTAGADATDPDITFSGNVPYVTWHEGSSVLTGHFASLTSFHVDARAGEPADGRSPISSSCTADPFTADGAQCAGGAIGTPFFPTLADGKPKRLLAHAYVPDQVQTLRPAFVAKHAARLVGAVDPAGAAVHAHFEFGATTAYGLQTGDVRIPAGNGAVRFAADVAGLPAGTVVHYRTVAQTDFGTVAGPDATLRTHGRHRHGENVWIPQRRLRMTRSGVVTVRLSCAERHGRCTGVVALRGGGRVLGRAPFAIRAQHMQNVRVHLGGRSQRLVRSHRGLRVRVAAGAVQRTLPIRVAR